MRDSSPAEEQLILAAVARLRAGVMAIVGALMGGVGLLVATLWLVIRGGEKVGLHLGLLAVYFPGYRVTATGALVGLAYGALVGAIVGWSFAWVYNRIAWWRSGRPETPPGSAGVTE